MKQTFLTILICTFFTNCFSQNCKNENTKIDANFAYINKSEDLEIPLNEDWNVVIENQKAVLVFFRTNDGKATGGIVKNKNGYAINSAHDIGEDIMLEMVRRLGVDLEDRKLTDIKLKNIPAKLIEYNNKIYNMGEITLASGIMVMIVNDGYTYIFMFNTRRDLKNCYIPFFKNILRNTYFGPEWY